MLANVNELASLFIAGFVFDMQETPLLNGAPIIGTGEQPAAAESRRRWRNFPLPVQTSKKIVKQPIRNGISLARINPAKREKMTEQHLPMRAHVSNQAPPIDFVALLENEIDDVGSIMTVPLLDERLGPEKFGRAYHGHAMTEHASLSCVLKPVLLDRHGPVTRTEDDVNEIGAAVNLSEPTFIRGYRMAVLQVRQQAGKFRRRRKDVQVLGGAPPIGVEVQCIPASDHERKTRFEEISQDVRIEPLRLGKRREVGRIDICRAVRTQRSNLAISRVHRISPCSVHRTPIDTDAGSSLEPHR